jgi:SAM-dependent methyltransferase
LDAVLIVDAYHEMADPVTLLRNVAAALKPNGRIGIVDFKLDGGGPGPPIDERVEPDVVLRDAERAGLDLLSNPTFLRYQYLLIFGKKPAERSARRSTFHVPRSAINVRGRLER